MSCAHVDVMSFLFLSVFLIQIETKLYFFAWDFTVKLAYPEFYDVV